MHSALSPKTPFTTPDYKNPPVHFIWVGPPSTLQSGGEVGHDMRGPKRLISALATENKIFFWCLHSYKKYYDYHYNTGFFI